MKARDLARWMIATHGDIDLLGIDIDPERLSGHLPVLKGHRFSVAQVLTEIAEDGKSIREFCRRYGQDELEVSQMLLDICRILGYSEENRRLERERERSALKAYAEDVLRRFHAGEMSEDEIAIWATIGLKAKIAEGEKNDDKRISPP
jgi:uncharacterized protein (DUF433 family)